MTYLNKNEDISIFIDLNLLKQSSKTKTLSPEQIRWAKIQAKKFIKKENKLSGRFKTRN